MKANSGRTFFGTYRRSHTQVRYAFLFLGAILCSIGGMSAVLIGQITQVIGALEATQAIDREAAKIVRDTLTGSSIFIVVVAVVVAVIGFVYGARLANQIFGPLVPIKKFILKLKEGDYSSRILLRKDDEFTDIADELNALAQNLEQQQAQQREQQSKPPR
jgi:signal transduction histidine kinase